jgi:ABC-type Fe3+-hydroxamate transport system substrate-binding protein
VRDCSDLSETEENKLRVVSLVPSVTETLMSWGITPVGCTRFCDQQGLLSVGGTKNPNLEVIKDLEPDLVVMDAEENRLEDYQSLQRLDIKVHVLHITSIEDVEVQISELAKRVGVRWPGLNLPTPPPSYEINAFVPIWRNPYMSIGESTYCGSLLGYLGVNLVPTTEKRYYTLTLEDAAKSKPDIVLAPSEPYPFSKRQLPELASVAPVYFIDGRDLFWWGARTTTALSNLASFLKTVQSEGYQHLRS